MQEKVQNLILDIIITLVSGGKFANGAVTGAFMFMYNDAMHDEEAPNNQYNNLGKGLNALWNKRYEILDDHIEGIKGFFKGVSDINNIDISKNPEAEPFIFYLKTHRYQSDIAGTGYYKLLRLSKMFEPGVIYDTGESVNDLSKECLDIDILNLKE